MITVDAFKKLPEFPFRVLYKHSKFWTVTLCQYAALAWKYVWVGRTVELYLSVSTCVDSFQDVVKERIGILECYEYLGLAKQSPLRAERLRGISNGDRSSLAPSEVH